ncbi:unnamed protein product [Soboliphyme baturini]|uniref:DUF3048_C domain-containing protein n=1 Tax=Soboliphyme baturini TaxID=241478 RepID=A0A183IDN4_9BILA|nr:unnamed protein product [Soboliphyme baturini]
MPSRRGEDSVAHEAFKYCREGELISVLNRGSSPVFSTDNQGMPWNEGTEESVPLYWPAAPFVLVIERQTVGQQGPPRGDHPLATF